MVNENNSVALNQVQHLAAAGHFRMLALWVNQALVPQGIYAQVQADRRPGCLRILLESKHDPQKEPSIQLVCHRLWHLNSSIIEGAHIIARPIGQTKTLWQRRVKILTPQQRLQKRKKQPKPSGSKAEQPSNSRPGQTRAPGKASWTMARVAPTSAKRLSKASHGTQNRTKRSRSNGAVHPSQGPAIIRPNAEISALATLEGRSVEEANRRAQRRRRALRRARKPLPNLHLEQHFKHIRAVVVTGSAAAAFILGCLTEVVVSGNGPALPHWSAPTSHDQEWGTEPEVDATEVAFSNRLTPEEANFIGTKVEAALEPVAVMPHNAVADPTDPTITLLFGGEVALGDLDLVSPNEADQILSQISAYQQADVSMVNLGNSLATAGTSLQENYHHRTRPDAVAALKEGGVDIVGLNSDRTMEHGSQGLIETLETLDREGIYRIGAGRDQREARRPEVLDVKGQRIAYLGYTPASQKAAEPEKAGTNAPTQEMILEDITAIRPEVDWVVVNYRWLGDLALDPNPEQLELSRMAVDAGADLVVGYHPTQLQGAEVYKGRPIVYALGDFIFDDTTVDESQQDHETAALKVSLGKGKMKVEFLPVTVQGSTPQAAMGEAGEEILQKIRQASKTLPAPMHFPVELEAQPRPRITPKASPAADPDAFNEPKNAWGEIEPSLEVLPQTDSGFSNGSNAPTINPFETQYEGDWGDGAAENFDYWPDAPVEAIEPDIKQSPNVDPSQENPFAPIPSETSGGFDSDPVQEIDAGAGQAFEQEFDPEFIEQQPLEGDPTTIEGWGPKSSPHREFSPIPSDQLPLENSPSLPQSNFSADPVSDRSTTLPVLDTDPIDFEHPDLPSEIAPVQSQDAPPIDAIQPYSEPLVGPLTQNPALPSDVTAVGLGSATPEMTPADPPIAMAIAQNDGKPSPEKQLPLSQGGNDLPTEVAEITETERPE